MVKRRKLEPDTEVKLRRLYENVETAYRFTKGSVKIERISVNMGDQSKLTLQDELRDLTDLHIIETDAPHRDVKPTYLVKLFNYTIAKQNLSRSLLDVEESPAPEAPEWGLRLVKLIMPGTTGENLVGDLVEEFNIRSKTDSAAARREFWRNVRASIFPIIARGVVRLIRLLLMIERLSRWLGW